MQTLWITLTQAMAVGCRWLCCAIRKIWYFFLRTRTFLTPHENFLGWHVSFLYVHNIRLKSYPNRSLHHIWGKFHENVSIYASGRYTHITSIRNKWWQEPTSFYPSSDIILAPKKNNQPTGKKFSKHFICEMMSSRIDPFHFHKHVVYGLVIPSTL